MPDGGLLLTVSAVLGLTGVLNPRAQSTAVRPRCCATAIMETLGTSRCDAQRRPQKQLSIGSIFQSQPAKGPSLAPRMPALRCAQARPLAPKVLATRRTPRSPCAPHRSRGLCHEEEDEEDDDGAALGGIGGHQRCAGSAARRRARRRTVATSAAPSRRTLCRGLCLLFHVTGAGPVVVLGDRFTEMRRVLSSLAPVGSGDRSCCFRGRSGCRSRGQVH